ncbi:myb-like protein AA [Oppia nitens]|uniref:myb-like protein AA n=1 Tax=Oppia nitens TaxID=1686743 RepID=UPI0023DB4324|nr:myb-like protein AA [Oppia nitens]
MGCGAAKAVQTIDDNTNVSNESDVKDSDNKFPTNYVIKSDVTNATNGSAVTQRRMSRPMTPVPKPVAFDIPLDTHSTEAITETTKEPLKLLPKRLLTLAEQPTHQMTAKQLSDKQLRAEEKRNELLEERKQKAHNYNQKFLSNNNSVNNNDNIDSDNNTDDNNDNTNDLNYNEENVMEIINGINGSVKNIT